MDYIVTTRLVVCPCGVLASANMQHNVCYHLQLWKVAGWSVTWPFCQISLSDTRIIFSVSQTVECDRLNANSNCFSDAFLSSHTILHLLLTNVWCRQVATFVIACENRPKICKVLAPLLHLFIRNHICIIHGDNACNGSWFCMCSEGSDNSLYLFPLALYTRSRVNFN